MGKEERVKKPLAAPSCGEGSSREGGNLFAKTLTLKRMKFTCTAARNMRNVDN